MPAVPTLTLNDSRTIPQLGLGVWQIPNDQTRDVVRAAIAAEYRSIDTAALYHNEVGVGEGIRAAGVARDALFVTTKLWHDDHAYDAALHAFDASLERLGMDHVDLYLIHWPAPRQNRYVDAWKALVRLREEGRARSIGVSNFNPDHLARIIDATGVVPAVNQIELHPRFPQRAAREVHARLGILTEAWSPLGQGEVLDDPTLAAIARKHGKTPAQVVIRWHIDLGNIVIPKTTHAERLRENIDAFDFQLDADDMSRIDGLERADGRLGLDPATFG
jgi:2,5-diketo-D-gluconate reductase A